MNAPFYKFGAFGDEVSLIVAFVIGIGFGFFLERAGFGNARLLAAQFYFRDLRVLKVMFTAIVTAMVGVFGLARIGVLDLSLVYLTPTFLVPQIVGGLLLGVGFVIGGYCPGTSCVSAATGRVDGMVYILGMIGGLVGFAEIYPHIERFTTITAMGKLTLAEYLGIPYGVLVFAVVVMALGAFVAAEWAEKKFGGKSPAADALLTPTRKLTPVRGLALAFVALGLLSAIAGNPYRGPFARVDTKQLALDAGTRADHVSVDELANWLIEGRNDFLVIDVRDEAAFAAYHIPGAINVPLAALASDFAAANERVIFYSDGGIHAAQAWLLLRSLGYPAVYMLLGGLEEWNNSILFPTAPDENAAASAQVEFARRAAIAKYFGGQPRANGDGGASGAPKPLQVAPPAPAAPPPATTPPAGRKKKEGC